MSAERLRRAAEVADDLALNGLRFEMNPTINAQSAELGYLAYIKRMDDHAREIGERLVDLLGDAE